ncbi:MAG: endonuclease III [Actinomycetota bacterium]
MATTSASSPAEVRLRARTILGRLKRRYPEAGTALVFRDPWQLLVATVLSAQTTDANVNRATPGLFARWPAPEDLAEADPEEVEAAVYSTGYYHQKARAIVALSADIVERFGGAVPADLDALTSLRGVGRKTASVVLAEAFRRPAIAVDTHVARLSRRLGLSAAADPSKVEADLRALFAQREWAGISVRFILFGREVCTARGPRCAACPLADRCPFPGKTPAG